MRFGIRTLDEYSLHGKTVLCRVDLNQPVDKARGKLKSVARLEACLPTLDYLSQQGAKTVLLAHQGSDIEYHNFYTTQPHAAALSELLGQEVTFIDDVCGPYARQAIRQLPAGRLLLLDNVRLLGEEQTLFEQKLRLTHQQQAQTYLVQKLAPLADLYVCDAFAAAHRDQPSLCGFEQVLPSAMGLLFEKEYCILSGLMEAPERPCVFVLGGAKISDAFLMLETVLSRGAADQVLTGGLVANIILAAKGVDIGQGSLDFIHRSNYSQFIDSARLLWDKYPDRITLPADVAYLKNDLRREAPVAAIDAAATVLDIGSQAAAEYARIIMAAKTVFVNGPLGVFEQSQTELGTKTVWEALGATSAYTVVGGGDSITATNKYRQKPAIDYICTGGGAMIRFLTGEELPVITALRHAAQTFPADKGESL